MRRRAGHFVNTLAATLGALGLGVIAQSGCAPRAEQADGKTLFMRYCASCHGVSGKGDGPVAKALRTPPTDLTALTRAGRFDERTLVAVIDGIRAVEVHGPREMPVWGSVFDEELRGTSHAQRTALLRAQVLVDYLRTIQEK